MYTQKDLKVLTPEVPLPRPFIGLGALTRRWQLQPINTGVTNRPLPRPLAHAPVGEARIWFTDASDGACITKAKIQ